MFVKVVPHSHLWETAYKTEEQMLRNILKDILEDIYHIGSTAVKDLSAKPIIDIMPVVTNIVLVDKYVHS